EVVREDKPIGFEPPRDRLGDATAIKDVRAVGGELAERAREIRLHDEPAWRWRLSTRREHAMPLAVGDHGGHLVRRLRGQERLRKSALGVVDRWPQQLGEGA